MALFPVREPPRVAEYSIKQTYGRLLDLVEAAFRKEKRLFTLGIYYPLGTAEGCPCGAFRQRGFGEPQRRAFSSFILRLPSGVWR